MNSWERTREPTEQKVGWRWLTTKWFRDPNGNEQEYVVIGRQNTRLVATIALTKDNEVIISEQFRAGPEIIMQEIPGGMVDENEDVQMAALRELREETGYAPIHIEHLGVIYKDAYSNAISEYFIAHGCERVSSLQTDEGEFVSVRTIPIKELFNNGRSGKMTDVDALFLAYDKLKELESSI